VSVRHGGAPKVKVDQRIDLPQRTISAFPQLKIDSITDNFLLPWGSSIKKVRQDRADDPIDGAPKLR